MARERASTFRSFANTIINHHTFLAFGMVKKTKEKQRKDCDEQGEEEEEEEHFRVPTRSINPSRTNKNGLPPGVGSNISYCQYIAIYCNNYLLQAEKNIAIHIAALREYCNSYCIRNNYC
jgi:hypothetical protein